MLLFLIVLTPSELLVLGLTTQLLHLEQWVVRVTTLSFTIHTDKDLTVQATVYITHTSRYLKLTNKTRRSGVLVYDLTLDVIMIKTDWLLIHLLLMSDQHLSVRATLFKQGVNALLTDMLVVTDIRLVTLA